MVDGFGMVLPVIQLVGLIGAMLCGVIREIPRLVETSPHSTRRQAYDKGDFAEKIDEVLCITFVH